MLTLSLWALIGCTTPFGLGGTEIEDTGKGADTLGEADSNDSTGGGAIAIADAAWSCGDASGSSLHLVGGQGLVGVLHEGVEDRSCVSEWEITAASDADGVVSVTYTPAVEPDTASCAPCQWDFSYAVTGLEAGAWTIKARDDQGSVDVR